MRAAILRTFTERLEGKQASRMRAFTTAVASGAAVAVVVYRLLRSGEEQGSNGTDDGSDAEERERAPREVAARTG